MKKNPHKNYKLLFLVLILPVLALACSLTAPRSNPEQTTKPVETVVVVAEPTVVINDLVQAHVQDNLQNNNDFGIVEEEEILIALYARVNPSVVNITTYIVEEGEAYPSSQGSGFVYDDMGHIVTNAHVVHGSSQVDVAFSDGSIEPGEIVGQDLHSDLAVIKVNTLPPSVPSLALGKINEVTVGQTVIAIGNPFGLGGTLTRGVVSALGRTIPALTSFSIPRSIQTDAAINPGNSGGPLLNLEGEVIGVNAQIQTNGLSQSNQGVGFAIPSSIVARVVPELIQNGHFDWAWLGVRGTDMTPTIAEAMKVDTEQGAYMSSIIGDGPAGRAGLIGSIETEKVRGRIVPIGGDVIVAINGRSINSFDDLLVYIALESNPGDTVTVTILRDGELLDLQLTLDPRPETIENLLP